MSNADSGGILTIGILGAIWSSSAAVVAIIGSLNRAYDIEEGRPWWKVRLTAIGLTVALAVFILMSFTSHRCRSDGGQRIACIVTGPRRGVRVDLEDSAVAARFLPRRTAVGLVYYFAPDAEQDWVWITPGAVLGTVLWLVVSLVFKFYVANFADYNATYGAVGGVIVLLLWFYISGLAILVGAEMNAEIEHASPYGKDPGEKVPGQKKKIGAAAARAYRERLKKGANASLRPAHRQPVAAFQATPSSGDRKLGIAVGLPLLASRVWNRVRRRARSGRSHYGGRTWQ